MKIIFATKNYSGLISEVFERVSDFEEFGKIKPAQIIPGLREIINTFDGQTKIEANVDGKDILIIAGSSSEEFMECIDIVEYCFANNCGKIEIVCPFPTWSKGDGKNTDVATNRVKILDELLVYKVHFINPLEHVARLSENRIFFENHFTTDLIKSFVDSIGNVVVYLMEENVWIVNFCKENGIETFKDGVDVTGKNVILISDFIKNGQDWNGVAKNLLEDGCTEVNAMILHCPSIKGNVLDKELFSIVAITDSYFNCYDNCKGENAFRLYSISEYICEKILRI